MAYHVILLNQTNGISPTDTSSIWTCRLCGCQHYNPIYLNLFTENGESPLVPTIQRMLDIKVGECDKLPTSLCQACATKVEEVQHFYDNCQEAQKILALQYGVQQDDCSVAADTSQGLQILQPTVSLASITLKDDLTQQVIIPTTVPISSGTTTTTTGSNGPVATLSADKLLEAAIKDTCILSEESDESGDDSGDDGMTDDQSASEDKDAVGKRTRSSMYARKSDPPVPRKRKKLVFTLEYLESKLNRKLNEEESARLKEYINKGQNTKIFEMLVGGGKDQVWKCRSCDEEIRGSPKDVKEHYANIHQLAPMFPCQLCDKVCRSVNYYRIHRLSHLAEYPCETCGKVFKDNSKLVLHRQVHSNKRPHVCDICGKTFKRATTVRVHKRTVHGSKDEQFMFTCELCGKRFKTNFELKKHLDKHPTEENPLPYQCKYCPNRFADKAQQITHSNTEHANEGDFICHLCGKKVKTETALENHVKSHSGIRDLKCQLCDATFASRYTLNAHVKRHAITEPLFSCPYCGKGSKSKANLDQHIRIHTGVRPYVCNVCNAAFKHRSHLKVHMTIHTGEHPFVCHECGKTFRTNKQRTSHMSYVHNTVRNFACEVCGKAFKTLKDLKIHSTLHTGEKPNICGECGKAFRVRANYFKHRKIHQRASAEQQHQQQQQQQDQQQHHVQHTVLTTAEDGSVIPTVTVTLPATIEVQGSEQVQQTPMSVAVHDVSAVHGTSTISAEGVLLFRSAAQLPSMANLNAPVKDYTGLNG